MAAMIKYDDQIKRRPSILLFWKLMKVKIIKLIFFFILPYCSMSWVLCEGSKLWLAFGWWNGRPEVTYESEKNIINSVGKCKSLKKAKRVSSKK